MWRRVLLVDAEYISESEDETPKIEDGIERGRGDTILCYPQDDPDMESLLAHKVQRDDKTIVEQGQRRSIFQTACTIKGEVCKLIIDGGSASNMISKDVVESLSLPTWEHPKPYYMKWINDVCKVKVTHRVKVPFLLMAMWIKWNATLCHCMFVILFWGICGIMRLTLFIMDEQIGTLLCIEVYFMQFFPKMQRI